MSKLNDRITNTLKNQYEIGQQDPRPFNPESKDVLDSIKFLKSDGFHTFDELYEYRMLYNALIFNEWAKQGIYDVHLSYRHHDGELCFGKENYFIVVAETPAGQICNHYHGIHRSKFHNVPEKERANEWDGSDSKTIAKRLSKIAQGKYDEKN